MRDGGNVALRSVFDGFRYSISKYLLGAGAVCICKIAHTYLHRSHATDDFTREFLWLAECLV